MELLTGILLSVFFLGTGIFAGYSYADKMPDDDYGRCLWMAAKAKSGANVKDCDGYVQDRTIAGKIENYKKCLEVNKILMPAGVIPAKETEKYLLNCAELKTAVKYKQE